MHGKHGKTRKVLCSEDTEMHCTNFTNVYAREARKNTEMSCTNYTNCTNVYARKARRTRKDINKKGRTQGTSLQ